MQSSLSCRFLAFGLGPRICPGQKLALMEVVAALVTLVHNYDITLGCERGEIKRLALFTSQPSKLPIIVKARY